MPAPLIAKTEVLARLTREFLRWGYDGATLARLSAATGLVKASLYHYFPKGKQDMARAVLQHLGETMERDLFQPLRWEPDPQKALREFVPGLIDFYRRGDVPCILQIFSFGTAAELFGETIRAFFRTLLDELTGAQVRAGREEGEAHGRAARMLILIQGSLIVSRGLGDHSLFISTMETSQRVLLQP